MKARKREYGRSRAGICPLKAANMDARSLSSDGRFLIRD